MRLGLGAATVLALSGVGTGVARAADAVPKACVTAGVDTSAVKTTFDVVSGEIGEPSDSPLGAACYFYNKNLNVYVVLYPKGDAANEAANVTHQYMVSEPSKRQAVTGLGVGAALFLVSTKMEGARPVAAFFTARSFFVLVYGEFLTSTGEHQFIAITRVIHAKLG
jgi:hypothetical protein